MNDLEQVFWESFERNHSDKSIHGYQHIYGSLPRDITSILEIGIYWGGSLITAADLFPQANPIWGFDLCPELLDSPESNWRSLGMNENPRMVIIQGDIRSYDFSKFPEFDLIIDDGTHEPDHIKRVWDNLWRKAKRYYIIEDIYLGRMMDIWNHVIKDVPKAQVMFWRTSDHCGDERIKPDSDSQCIVIKL